MEQHEIKTLRILEAFEQDPTQTQRDLSRKLRISLGMVNVFTKRLVKKGYFKIRTIPKNRLQYILTPKGMAEKSRLTYQYVIYSMQYYKETRAKIKAVFNELSEARVKTIYFYGAGELAEISYISLQETNLKLGGIIDNDLSGREFLGYPVLSPEALTLSTGDVVLVTRMEGHENALKVLRKHGVPEDQIVDLRN